MYSNLYAVLCSKLGNIIACSFSERFSHKLFVKAVRSESAPTAS